MPVAHPFGSLHTLRTLAAELRNIILRLERRKIGLVLYLEGFLEHECGLHLAFFEPTLPLKFRHRKLFLQQYKGKPSRIDDG